jgi:uncharacterized protein YraI
LVTADSGAVGGSDGTGGGTGGGTAGGGGPEPCVPRPALVPTVSSVKPPFPAIISTGTCQDLDTAKTYALFNVVPGGATDKNKAKTTGSATGIPVSQSATTVRVSLGDLLTTPHSVVIQASEKDRTTIVCGDIGGLRVGDDIAVGLRDVSGSGYGGVAWLRGQDNSTLAYVFLAPGLGGAASVPVGAKVVTTVGVNLRSGPSTDSSVVTVLDEGAELEVTGEAQGDWLPVKVTTTGETGSVAAQYLAAATK